MPDAGRTPGAPVFDIGRATWSAAGMDGFYWPLSRTRSEPVRESLLGDILALLRNGGGEAGPGRVFGVLIKYAFFEMLRLFEAAALWRRIARDGAAPELPAHFERLRALAQGRPPLTGFFSNLAAGPGPAQDNALRILAKRWVKELAWNGAGGFLGAALGRRRGVPCVGCNSLVRRHAAQDGVSLSYLHLKDWFSPLPAGFLEQAGEVAPDLAGWLRATLRRAFAAGGEDCPPAVEQAMLRWALQGGRFVDFHLDALRRRTDLPAELWCGSPGANPWQCMLAAAVRERGGRVVAHDHGYGDSHHEQLGHYLTEYPYCDEFYTYNATNVRVKAAELRPELLFTPSLPRFACPAPDAAPRSAAGPRILRREGRIARLIYVATAYHGEQARARPILSDVQMLDYQARLFGALRAAGVQVLFKPHPEGAVQPPAGFAESFGFTTVRERFEQVAEQFDAYLVDFISSSTTMRVLSSDKPVIFVDLGYPRLIPEAAPLLARRCAVVAAREEADNHIELDWDALARALDSDGQEFSMEFVDTYYGDIR